MTKARLSSRLLSAVGASDNPYHQGSELAKRARQLSKHPEQLNLNAIEYQAVYVAIEAAMNALEGSGSLSDESLLPENESTTADLICDHLVVPQKADDATRAAFLYARQLTIAALDLLGEDG